MRAFSLFTPLVGTAVLIMTVLITISMLENDARISQTLTAGFEAASQEAAGRLIRAAAAAQIAYNLDAAAYGVLNGSALYDLKIQCSSTIECVSKAKEAIESDVTDSLLITTGFYNGLSAAVGAASDYGLAAGQDIDGNIAGVLKNMHDAGKEPFGYDWTERLTVRLRTPQFTAYSSKFEADFTKGSTRIRVSILPDAASVQTADKVGEMIEDCADKAVKAGLPVCGIGSYSCATDYKLKHLEGLAVQYCK